MKHLPRVPAKIFDGFLRSLQIDEHDLEQLAKQSGWRKREPRKITAAGLLTALCLESVQGDANFNDQARTPVRLVSAPVDKETAAHRRRKAKKEMHGHEPSAEVLALMDWAIFLTPLPQEGGDFKILFKLYGLRWRIEIIFKTWKSHLNFDSLHRVSEVELKTLLTARLLLITEGTNVLYRRCFLKIRELYDRDFSLQKSLKRLSRMPELFGVIFQAFESPSSEPRPVCEHLLRYCCYDKRTRKNFFDQCRDLP